MDKKLFLLVVVLVVTQGLSAQSTDDQEQSSMLLDRKISELEGKASGFVTGMIVSALGIGGAILGASSNSSGPAAMGVGAALVGSGLMTYNLVSFMTTSVEIEQARQQMVESLNLQVYELSRKVGLQSQ